MVRWNGQGTADCDRYIVSEVRSLAELNALREEWDELAGVSETPSVFTTWQAASVWLNSFATSQIQHDDYSPLRILVARNGDGICDGIAPLYARTGPCDRARRCMGAGSARRGGMFSREWRLIGDLGRYGEGMCEEPVLLVRPGREAAILRRFLDYICSRQSEWDIFKLRVQIPVDGAPWELPPAPAEVRAEYRRNAGSQIATIGSDWPAYRRTLSRSMRDNLPYYPRLLERRGHAWSVSALRSEGEIREAAELLIALHRERAEFTQGRRHHDHMPTDVHAEYLRSLLTTLARDGMAAIWRLEIDGETAAMQAFLEYRGQVVFYYSGFREQWREFSPLTILAARVIEDACARGMKAINFLPGVEVWKTRWGAATAYHVDDVQCSRRRVSSLARILVRSTVRELEHKAGRKRDLTTGAQYNRSGITRLK